MLYRNLPIENFKPDLRSPKETFLKKGLAIKLLRAGTLLLLDVIFLTLAWNLAVFYGEKLDSPWTQNSTFLILTITVHIGIIATNGLYKEGSYRRHYISIIRALSTSELGLLFIAFIYEPNRYISRSTFLLSWLFSVIFICTARYIFDLITKRLRKQGSFCHPVFLITDASEQEENIKLITKDDCYRVQRIADPSCLDLTQREKTFKDFREQGIVEAFVSWSAIKNRLYVCWHFYTAGITLRILPSQAEVHHPKSVYGMVGNVPCMTLPTPIIIGVDFWLKRLFDLCFSIILLLILSPLLLLIALLIRLDSHGPIFFRQKRIGLHGKEFKIWKFRTMVANAEKLQGSLEAKNEVKDGVLFKMKDDPRITKVGKFLRAYSLDELPQLLNVTLGDMSLVGPRPLPLRDVEKFTSRHFIRQEVLPGITGLWQVSGRSNIDNFEDAVKLDINYIENWSIWLDFQILLQTVKVVTQKTGAY